MTEMNIQKTAISRRRPGMNQEILLTLVLLLGAALLFGGFLFLRYTEQNLLESHLKLLVQGTQSAARDLDNKPGLKPDYQLLQDLQSDLAAQSWWLYNRNLQLLGSFVEEGALSVGAVRLRGLLLQHDDLLEVVWPGLFGLFSTADERIEATVATPVGTRDRLKGLLVVRYSLEPLRARLLAAQRWVFLYALGYGLVLAAAGFFLLRRNVVLPVKKLLLATEKVACGDLDATMEEKGPAEISELAHSFNSMTTALRQSRGQTEAHIQKLNETNDALQQTQEELIRSEKLATVGHLAAGMAHEVGNPLGALTGYLALLQSELPDGAEKDMARLAAEEAERIDRLVRELLDYATPGKVDPDPIDPWTVVLTTLDMLLAQGALKGVELDYDSGSELPSVAIDPHKLTQVLVNLLLNARDACDKDGMIRIQAEVEQGLVALQVEDNGAGMSYETRQQLFEPFFTTKAPGKGRGLGLAVCQRVIAEAGGEIRVESTAGEGSCFSLMLPIFGESDG